MDQQWYAVLSKDGKFRLVSAACNGCTNAGEVLAGHSACSTEAELLIREGYTEVWRSYCTEISAYEALDSFATSNA